MNDERKVQDHPFPARVGDRLKVAREAKGLSLKDIASDTRIPMRHLQAIEDGDYDGLPAPTYSTGFVKSWARHLGLDGPALSAEFRQEMALATRKVVQPPTYQPADPRRTPPVGLALLALLVAVVVGLGYLYWRGTAEDPARVAATASDQPAATRPAAPPAQAAPSAPQPAPTAAGPVVITSSQDVWIKVSDGGKTLFMNTLHPGERFEVPGDAAQPLLTTGRPGATNIMVGETPVPTVGDAGRAAKDVSLKAADLLARIATPAPATQPPANAPTPVENVAGPA